MGNARRRRNPAKQSDENNEKQKTSKKARKSDESSSCFSKCIYAFLFSIVLVGSLAAFGYYRAPFTASPVTDFAQKVELVGPFEPNRKLTEGIKITGLEGPESIEEDGNGNLYTGLADGRIVRIAPSSDGKIGEGKVTNVTNGVVENLAKSISGAKHGRPLGLRLRGERLFVADAAYGIFSVNLKSGEVTSLVAPDAVDPHLGFPDDLSVTSDGNLIYFSDVTSKYPITELLYTFLSGDCDGRILQYNVRTKEIRTVMANLCFPNGVQLSEDEKLLFVCETTKYRVRVIDMTTWKTKQFVDVPILSDNIRPTGKGSYWISGGSPWTPSYSILERNHVLRQIIGGLLPVDLIMGKLTKEYNIVVEMSEDGEILQTLQDPDGQLVVGLSQATTLSDGRLALGTYSGPHLAISNKKHSAIGKQ